MTNGDRIRESSNEALAAFLHLMQAGAVIDGCDSEESLVEWLYEEEEDEEEYE